MLAKTLSPASHQIHLHQSHKLCALEYLPENIQNREDCQNQIRKHKIDSRKATDKHRVPGNEDEKQVNNDNKPRSPRVQKGLEWHLVQAMALLDPGRPQAEVRNTHKSPGDERGGARDIDQIGKDLSGARRDVEDADQAEGVGEDDGPQRRAVGHGLGEEPGRAAVAREGQQRPRGDVDAAVDARKLGRDHDDVEQVAGAAPAGAHQGDGPRALGRLAAGVEEVRARGRDDDAREEDEADEDDQDPKKGLADGAREVALWVPALGRGEGQHLGAAVVDSGQDESLPKAIDSVGDGSWVSPVLEANVFAANGARVDEYGHQEANHEYASELPSCQVEFHLAPDDHAEETCALKEGPKDQYPSPARRGVGPLLKHKRNIVV